MRIALIVGIFLFVPLTGAAEKYIPMPDNFWGAGNVACKVEPAFGPEKTSVWHVHVYIKFPKALSAMRPYDEKNGAKQKKKARRDCQFWLDAQEKARDRFWEERKAAIHERL